MAQGRTTYGAGGVSQTQATWKPPAIRMAPAPPPSGGGGGGGSPQLPSLKDLLAAQKAAQEQSLALELEREKQLNALARREAARSMTFGAPVGGVPRGARAGRRAGPSAPTSSWFGSGGVLGRGNPNRALRESAEREALFADIAGSQAEYLPPPMSVIPSRPGLTGGRAMMDPTRMTAAQRRAYLPSSSSFQRGGLTPREMHRMGTREGFEGPDTRAMLARTMGGLGG